MPDIIKALIDGLDKISDILNVGRLLFYTVAGLCAVVPIGMLVALLESGTISEGYWARFMHDFLRSVHQYPVWLAALVFGFIIAVWANAILDIPVPGKEQDPHGYAYQYARLFFAGSRPKEGTTKDFAAWLISEYYRYYEIGCYIPFGVLLSLPLYSVYTLIFLIRASLNRGGLALSEDFVAFPIWIFVTALAWTVIWPEFWIRLVIAPTFRDWLYAKRDAIDGLKEFIGEADAAIKPQQPAKSTD